MAWFHQPRAQILRFHGLIMFWNEFRILKPQNLGSFLMKSSQSNFNLRLPGSYLVRSYLITTVLKITTLLNLHPLFLKMGHPAFCKKAGWKNRVILYSKREWPGCLFSFWTILFGPICLFGTWEYSVYMWALSSHLRVTSDTSPLITTPSRWGKVIRRWYCW